MESEPGQGSCFEVIMNLKVAENRSVSLEPQAEKEELDKNILKGMRFLCAEDNEHVNHVATQLPYVGLVAAVCMIGYFIIGVLQAVGLTQFSLLALPVCIVLLVAILFVIREKTGGKEEI